MPEKPTQTGRLEGRAAFVTGAASGFGRAIAQRFSQEGARVAVVDIDEKGACESAAALGPAALPLQCDVADGAQVREAVDTAWAAFGGIDILVNNAGWSHPNRPLLEIDEASFRKVLDINVMSIFHTCKALVPKWRARGGGGVIINMASTAAERPRPGLTWYNASKGAVVTMTKSMALELAPDDIRVTAISPVLAPTALLETFIGALDSPESRARFVDTIPLGRLCSVEDVANAALFLASEDAKFLTGTVLSVDGGRTV